MRGRVYVVVVVVVVARDWAGFGRMCFCREACWRCSVILRVLQSHTAGQGLQPTLRMQGLEPLHTPSALFDA